MMRREKARVLQSSGSWSKNFTDFFKDEKPSSSDGFSQLGQWLPLGWIHDFEY